jgi:hypothetical protein
MRKAWSAFWGSFAELFDMIHNTAATGNAYSRWARSEAESFEALSREEQQSALKAKKAQLLGE